MIDLTPCTKQPCELKLGTNVNATVIFASSECSIVIQVLEEHGSCTFLEFENYDVIRSFRVKYAEKFRRAAML